MSAGGGWRIIRDDTDHNRSFGVGFVVGLLSLSEDEPLRSSREQDQRTCSRRSMSWGSVTLPLSCPVWAILRSIASICLDRSGLTREMRATDMDDSASSQLVTYDFITAHVVLWRQGPVQWPTDLASSAPRLPHVVSALHRLARSCGPQRSVVVG